MEVYVKDWFFEKEINYEYYECSTGKCFFNWGGEIVRETEKAYLLRLPYRYVYSSCDMLYANVWVPKSCTLTVEEHDRKICEREQRFERRYGDLLDFAKANGVKGVRRGMKVKTILRKINESGLTYEY